MDDFQQYIATSRYARWLPEEQRRETWEESVTRYINFLYTQAKNNTTVAKQDLSDLYSILGANCEK